MAVFFALLAILTQPTTPPADFLAAIGPCSVPVIEPGTFVGCTTADIIDDAPYAGLLWIDGAPSWETGP